MSAPTPRVVPGRWLAVLFGLCLALAAGAATGSDAPGSDTGVPDAPGSNIIASNAEAVADATPGTAPLPTVVSTNLCADLLLLTLGAPEQIRSVSRQAQDARLSPVATAAAAYPANRGTVEELLYLKPDLALVYTGWGRRQHAELLAREGIRLIELPYPRTWPDALETTRAVATAIGRGEVGAAIAAAADRRLAALADQARPYRVLYLRPSGGSAGQGTYVDDLITRLGMRNLAAEQGHVGWGRFALESLVLAPPDVFLLGYFDQPSAAVAAAYGRHPLLQALLAETPTLALPARGWGCGGLELVAVAEQIITGLERVMPVSKPAHHETRD